MPFLHPLKGKIRTSNQIELYQKMNPLACSEGLEQMSKSLGIGLRGSITEYMVVKDA
jgi:hypothetical protein